MTKFSITCAFSSVVAICIVIVSGGVARAGAELITLTGSGASQYQQNVSSVIPVKVKLSNGNPDYIDMTYYATDSTGASVSVSPTSARHYLVKGQSVTDNVILSNPATGTVTFVALAEGECVGPDGESYTQNV